MPKTLADAETGQDLKAWMRSRRQNGARHPGRFIKCGRA